MVYRGLYDGPTTNLAPPAAAQPVVFFAGRHIPEKRVTAIVPAVERARDEIAGLRCEIFGDGPDRATVLEQIADRGIGTFVEAPGFVDQERIDNRLTRALCLLLPSSREGYGLIVVEAAARGVPSIVVAGPDNAATELIDEGVNGFVAQSASPDALADAIIQVSEGGPALRASTQQWFVDHAGELSVTSLVEHFAPGGTFGR